MSLLIREKPPAELAGVRAVATGAAIFTVGVAAFKGLRLLGRQSSARSEDEPPESRGRGAEGRAGGPPTLDLPRQRWTRVPVSRR